jgi:hypothetical protein
MMLSRWLVTVALVLVLAGCQPTGREVKLDGSGSTGSAPERPAEAARVVEIPMGTVLEVRVDEALSTRTDRAGDKFHGTLDEPVEVGGREVLSRGARVEGHVTTSRPSGRLKGRAVIGITLDSVEYRGRRVPVETTLDSRASAAHKRRNIEMIGGGAGIGAVIGAIAGGGKGAAIGAGAGAAAGTGVAAATGQLHVDVPAETAFSFKLKTPLTLAE